MALYAHISVFDPDSEQAFGPTLEITLSGDPVLSSVELSSSSSTAVYDISLFLVKTANEESRDSFVGVCSPLDLSAYGTSRPVAAGQLYRRSSVSLETRSAIIVEQLKTDILADLRLLLNSLDTLNDMLDDEIVTHIPAATGSSSSQGKTATLIRAGLTRYPSVNPVGYHLSITCETTGYDDNVFYNQITTETAAAQMHRPIGVCSPADIAAYPVGFEEVDNFQRMFRSNTFDVVSANINELASGWLMIKNSFLQLMRALDATDNGPTTEIEVSVR